MVLEAKLDEHAETACIVAGDFNNEPFRAAYELLSDGRLHSDAAFAGARIDADSFLDKSGQVRTYTVHFTLQYSLSCTLYTNTGQVIASYPVQYSK